jgi:hypothetical protein
MAPTEVVYNGKWFTCTFVGKPTEFDPVGCDGLYVKKITIKWWGWPVALFWAFSGGIRSRLL